MKRIRISETSERREPVSAVLTVIGVAAAARTLLGATIGLGVDESYAVAVARPFSMSYYDHPPLTFWIIGVVERLGGAGHPLLLRAPFIALFAGTTWLIYRVTTRCFGGRAGLYAVIVLNLIPVLGVSGGGWILPDGPLLFAFAATACSLAAVADAETDDRALRWWLAAGASAGLAMLSKYHAIFLFTGAFCYFATSRRNRWRLRHPEPYVAAAIAIAMSYPVLAWNARHQWISFAFQSGRAGLGHGLHISPLLQNIAGQAAYVLPWFWAPLLWSFAATVRRGPREESDETPWLLACLASGPIVVFTLVSIAGNRGLPHWAAPGYLMLVPLLGGRLAAAARGRHSLVVRYLTAAAVLSIALVSFAASQVITGWVSRAAPSLFRSGDPSLEALDWNEATDSLARLTSGASQVIVATNWIDAAKLGSAADPAQTVLCFDDDARHFRFTTDQSKLVGMDALLVVRAGTKTVASEILPRTAAYFQSVDSLSAITVHRDGRAALRLIVYRARSLQRPYAYPNSK